MKKATTILSILLTLFASMHLGIASHFCRGELAEARVVAGHGQAGCGMTCSDTSAQNGAHEDVLIPVSCCNDTFTEITLAEYSTVKSNYSCFTQLLPFKTADNKPLMPAQYRSFIASKRPPPLLTEVSLPFLQVFII